jgi:Nucleotide-diphospho-sugar transferase
MEVEVVCNFAQNDQGQILEVFPGFNDAYHNTSYLDMIDICSRSVSKVIPFSRTLFFTNAPKDLVRKNLCYSHINFKSIRMTHFEYDQLCFRIEYLKSKLASNWQGILIFTDIDVIFNKNILEDLDFDCDVYTGVDPHNNPDINLRGLPGESLMFNTTNGIFICKATHSALRFFEDIKEKIEEEHELNNFESYGGHTIKIQTDFLAWWCVIHSLSLILGQAVLLGEAKQFLSQSYKVGLLDEKIYNFCPDVDPSTNTVYISQEHLAKVKMFHFRGFRKTFMPGLARHLQLIS